MICRFGTFEFDDAIGELHKNGRLVALEPQPAKALAALLASVHTSLSHRRNLPYSLPGPCCAALHPISTGAWETVGAGCVARCGALEEP